MKIESITTILIDLPARFLAWIQDPLLLALRVFVGWQFFNAGLIKLQSWDSTLFLFQYEYQVPLLSPWAAAVLGTAGELIFPILLFIGLFGRLASVGLQFVNIMAVVAYAHVIFNPEFGTEAIADHYLWGLMLIVIAGFGPGRASIDYWLRSRSQNGVSAPTHGGVSTAGAQS